jgi:hypothetical protein
VDPALSLDPVVVEPCVEREYKEGDDVEEEQDFYIHSGIIYNAG